VTPRELWKATGHRAGSRERADKAEIILANQGGTAGRRVFRWEWGSTETATAP
jgi:hypothetical protein